MNPREKYEKIKRIREEQAKKRQVVKVDAPKVIIADDVLLGKYRNDADA